MSNADTAAAYPLRVVRGTTGTVHAAREVEVEILDFNAPTVAERKTGKFKTVLVKACGSDPNTLRVVSGVGSTEAEVSCKKCRKALGL